VVAGPLPPLQRIHGTAIAAADSPAEGYAAAEQAEAIVAPDDDCTPCQVMVSSPAVIACADAGDVGAAQPHLRRLTVGLVVGGAPPGREPSTRPAATSPARRAPATAGQRLLAGAAECFDVAGQPLDAQCRSASSCSSG
jgi:hypothetical protein